MTTNTQLATDFQQAVAAAGYTMDSLCQQLKNPQYRDALRDAFGGAAVYAEWWRGYNSGVGIALKIGTTEIKVLCETGDAIGLEALLITRLTKIVNPQLIETERWLAENKSAIESANDYVEKNGLPLSPRKETKE